VDRAEPDETDYEMFRPRDAAKPAQYTTPQGNRNIGSELNGDINLPFPFENDRQRDLRSCRFRRFFISHNKYMGLAPVDIQKGDLICILFGCRVPVVLRRVEDHYIFIGPAYFHGWMNGEAVKLYQEGKLPPQDFNIH
jgi:hypothetical protein